MTKRFLSLLLAMTFVFALCVMDVSAAGTKWVALDFEGDAVGEAPASFPAGQAIPAGVTKIVEQEADGNKYFRINTLAATGTLTNEKRGAIPNIPEMYVMFDFQVFGSTASNKYLCVDIHAGTGTGTRYSLFLRHNEVESGGKFSDNVWSKSAPHADGKWYTYLIKWKNIKTSGAYAEIYRKERGTTGDFTYIGSSMPATGSGWGSSIFHAYGSGIDCALDNVIMWNGTVSDSTRFSMNGETIDEMSQVTEGTLTAKAGIISDGTAGGSVMPSLVVFDGMGRMVDCKFESEVNIDFGNNVLSASVDTSEYYGNLEGGKAEFYVWEDLLLGRPAMEPAILD